ncbi:PIN domain-containing protein [Lacihabitans sp. LS3-19]|uniref:type II toxin-antitoxin system VapC family toxin n=1 Tax=Lacihabitans sp. LS3-19 TaxID=2487335 RepID=UPI0020CCBEAF|nr:PIN domain-containing protein [Lacihabitans sp. LS3-19]MCP9768687.1 PIN domain-containing protein [Lacihabitans sp. LS3-19]
MRKLFVDTNIVLDLLAKRMPFYTSGALLFSLADKKKLKLSVSAQTFANTNYVLSKLKTAQEAKEILRMFRLLVEVVPLSDKIIDLSLNNTKFTDFEDSLQYYSASESSCEIIITRNQKDFKSADLPVMNAEEFLNSM